MKVILVSGNMGNGKDVAADNIAKVLNKGNFELWERASLAEAVKNVFETSFGYDRAFIEQWKRNDECPPSLDMNIRKALQFIGDGFRKIKKSVWVDIAFKDENKKLILSDGRYLSEAEAVIEKNGLNILIYRPGFLNDDPNPSEAELRSLLKFCAENFTDGPIEFQLSRYLTEKLKNTSIHDTYGHNVTIIKDYIPEGIDFYDFFLINNGTLEDLYEKIDKLLIPYIKEKFNE